MIITHNLQSISANNNLRRNTLNSSKSLEKLSSGFRVNRAGDDAAGLAISEKMRGQLRGLSQANRNIQDGISLVQLIDSALGQMTDNLQRMRELAIQSANGTLTENDRAALQKEFGQLLGSIGDIAKNTHFNNTKVLSPTEASGTASSTATGTADIVFIIDTTGSMGGHIDSVKSNIQLFADSLQSQGVDFQLGLVAFGDTLPAQGADPISKYSFTSDIGEFKTNLAAMPNTGGGDQPESGLDAIMDPSNGALTFPFRSSASKQFIIVTDADVHDDKDISNPGIYNIDTVASDLKAAGIKATVVGTTGGNPQAEWEKVTKATDGSYLDIHGSFSTMLSAYADVIVEDAETMEKNSKMPTLSLQVGANAGNLFRVELFDARPEAMGSALLAVDQQEKAEKSIGKLDSIMKKVSAQRGKFGAYLNALEHISANVSNAEENLAAAESRIRDADMAKEMMGFQKNHILTQAAQAMLAQANKSQESVLQLLK